MQTIFSAFPTVIAADAAIHALQEKQINPARMNVLVQATKRSFCNYQAPSQSVTGGLAPVTDWLGAGLVVTSF